MRLAVDPFGRVYAPNVFRFSVEMIDTNGNQIWRIGRYGNVDDGKTEKGEMDPEAPVHLAWPAFITQGGGKIYVSDSINNRVAVVKFEYAAEEKCDIK